VKLHHLKSRQRVTIRVAVALVLLFAVAAWLAALAVERELQSRLDDDLRSDASEIATVANVLDSETLDELVDALAAGGVEVGDSDFAFVLLRPNAEPATFGSGTGPDAVPDVLDTPISELRGRAGEPFSAADGDGSEDSYRVLTIALDDGRVAVVARSLDSVNTVVEIVRKTFAIAALISIIILCGVVWGISRHALKPLEDVVETAHAIGAGNLSTRVDVRSTAPDVERLADAMNKMLARLQRAFDDQVGTEARLRQFVSDASHELRTPLAAILGYAELYHEGMAASPEEVETAMRRITAEGTRMQTLVEDLLLLARLDEGRPLASDAVDLAAVVEEAVSAIRTVDGDHEFAVDTEPAAVTGDQQALRQIVDNLLTNVVTHTPPGTTAHVRLRAAAPDGDDESILLAVSDDGPGMSSADASRVFDRFVRAAPARDRPGGAGLGLAIVDELVRAHHGTITVDTSPGRGTTFEIRLPTAATNPSVV
jgi:signal transduction histidine kinase